MTTKVHCASASALGNALITVGPLTRASATYSGSTEVSVPRKYDICTDAASEMTLGVSITTAEVRIDVETGAVITTTGAVRSITIVNVAVVDPSVAEIV